MDDLVKNVGLSVAMMLVILIFNALFEIVATNLDNSKTNTEKVANFMSKILISIFLNTALLPCLVNARPPEY